MSHDDTRRHPEMERYTKIVAPPGSATRQLFLKVDHQSFAIATDLENQEHAEWMRDMLCIALARMVRQCGGRGPE